MRACTAFAAGLGLSVLAIATAQAQPSRSAKSSNPADRASSAARKAPPSFIVDMRAARAGTPVDLGVHNVRPAASVGFAEAPAARTERASDPTFALSPAGAYGDAALLDANRYYEGRGAVSYRSSAVVVGEGEHAVDSVRMSVASVAPGGQTRPLALVRPDEDSFEDRDVDVTVTRGWPAAVSVGAGKYALDVTPHAGLGFGGAGGSAEAGATVRFGKKMEDQVVNSLGVQERRRRVERGWRQFRHQQQAGRRRPGRRGLAQGADAGLVRLCAPQDQGQGRHHGHGHPEGRNAGLFVQPAASLVGRPSRRDTLGA